MDKRDYAQCTPRRRDPSITEEPVVHLTSGYVQRARDSLPRQGSRRTWKLYQNYLLDMVIYRLGKVDDGTIEFRRRRHPAAEHAQPGLACAAQCGWQIDSGGN